MDAKKFRVCAKEMVDYVATYHETIANRPVASSEKPGYLRSLLPTSPPEEGEEWTAIMQDIENYIMPGVTHWQHPRFFGYFPTAHSFAATCADILSDSIGCMGFTWASCPVYTELEVIVLDWLVQLLDLPTKFLFGGPGGGVINSTASEVTLTMMFAARSAKFEEKKKENDFDIYAVSLILISNHFVYKCVVVSFLLNKGTLQRLRCLKTCKQCEKGWHRIHISSILYQNNFLITSVVITFGLLLQSINNYILYHAELILLSCMTSLQLPENSCV